MSAMSDVALVNIQVFAPEAIAAAKADGSYAAKTQADRRYFIWQGPLQTIPVGTEKDPVAFAQELRRALPLVNTLRLPFNANSFNADFSLDPRYEAFLAEAVRQKFRILFVYMDGEGQRYGSVGDSRNASADDIRKALQGEILDRAKASFGHLLDWLDRHPDVNAATWGLELMNEPASFKIGMGRLPKSDVEGRAGFVQLYATTMVTLGQAVQRRWHGSVLVGGFAYSALFNILAETRMPDGTTALDTIRRGIGPKLVWSSHLYPGWAGTGRATDVASLSAVLTQNYRVLGNDNILVTETNLGDVFNPFAKDRSQTLFAESYEWFADHGIGLGWWPGLQNGQAAFAAVGSDGTLSFNNLSAYAAGMNGFTLGQDAAGTVASMPLTLLPGRARIERTDPAYILDKQREDHVQGLALAVGRAGNDVLTGSANADNLLYGGPGQDRITGAGPHDYLFGQDGNDTLSSGPGDVSLFGGRGDDLLIAAGQYDSLTGGPGKDRFSIAPLARTVVTDFNPAEGDTIDFQGQYKTLADLLARTSTIDYTGNGGKDLIVWHGQAGYTVFLNMGNRLEDFVSALAEFPGKNPLPPANKIGTITGTPFSPTAAIAADSTRPPKKSKVPRK